MPYWRQYDSNTHSISKNTGREGISHQPRNCLMLVRKAQILTTRGALLLEFSLAFFKKLLVLLRCMHQGFVGPCSLLQSSLPAGDVLQHNALIQNVL